MTRPFVFGDWDSVGLYRPSASEIALGYVPGWLPVDTAAARSTTSGPLPRIKRIATLRREVENSVLAGLLRQPAVVAFSGGQDSTLILSIAVSLAQREGLPLPVAASLVYRGGSANEDAWRRHVLSTMPSLERVEIPGEPVRDVLGPVGRGWLDRFGVTWPFAGHAYQDILACARGGSLLTGEGGDEVFGPQRITDALAMATGRLKMRGYTVLAAARAIAPIRLRQPRFQKRLLERMQLRWLTPEFAKAAAAVAADEVLNRPLHFGAGVRLLRRHRSHVALLTTSAATAHGFDVSLHQPLLEPAVIEATAELGGPFGWAYRPALLREVFSDVVPAAVIARTDKADFTDATFGPESRAFAESWDGNGLDTSLVIPEALRAAWLAPTGNALSLLALQQAYVASRGRELNGLGGGPDEPMTQA